MYRDLVVLSAMVWLFVGLGTAGPGGDSAAVAQPTSQAQATEKPPEKNAPPWRPTVKTATGVSVEERIAMGVDEPTWVKEHGKVQPDVMGALKEQEELERNFDQDPKSGSAALFQGNRPVGFLGYTYVVVHLKHEQQGKPDSAENKAAIKALQTSLLSKLNAAEFSAWLCFPDRPAVLGWVNEQGLKKLSESETVRAIGIDTKPYPHRKAEFYSQGHEGVGGVSDQAKAAAQKAEFISVLVRLKEDVPQGLSLSSKDRQVRTLQDRVLSRLAAGDFRVNGRVPGMGAIFGWANAAALTKLADDPDVVGVGLPPPPARVEEWPGVNKPSGRRPE